MPAPASQVPGGNPLNARLAAWLNRVEGSARGGVTGVTVADHLQDGISRLAKPGCYPAKAVSGHPPLTYRDERDRRDQQGRDDRMPSDGLNCRANTGEGQPT